MDKNKECIPVKLKRWKNHEEFTKALKRKYPDFFEKIEILNEYIDETENIKCRCKVCYYEWETSPFKLLGRGPKCSECRRYNNKIITKLYNDEIFYRKSHITFTRRMKPDWDEGIFELKCENCKRGCKWIVTAREIDVISKYYGYNEPTLSVCKCLEGKMNEVEGDKKYLLEPIAFKEVIYKEIKVNYNYEYWRNVKEYFNKEVLWKHY